MLFKFVHRAHHGIRGAEVFSQCTEIVINFLCCQPTQLVPPVNSQAGSQVLRLLKCRSEVREKTKLLMLDGLACALVGAWLPWSATAVDANLRLEGCGTNPIIGWNRGATAPAAAMLNSSFIQGFELDDFHPVSPIHGASIVLPSLLACASQIGMASGEHFLLGAVAGFEVGPRVGLALLGAEMLSRGWHSGTVFGTFAAAVAVGVLLKLNASQFEDALGMAGTQSSGLTGARFGAMCKRMQHGFAARNGLQAAFLAAAGYTGIKKVFELQHGGFLSVFGEANSPDLSLISAGLGERWEIEQIIAKTYAVMGGIHAPLDALFEIASKRKLSPDLIDHIEVDLPEAAYRHGGWRPERPLSPAAAQMNVAFARSVAILDGAAMVRQFSPTRVASEDVWTLIPRINGRHETLSDEGGPTAQGNVRVTAHFTDGARLDSFVFAPKPLRHPCRKIGLSRNFHNLTRGIVEPGRQRAIIRAVLDLEGLRSISELINLVAPIVGGAFDEHPLLSQGEQI
jgi:2-methylcitrate dehydratase PrpD